MAICETQLWDLVRSIEPTQTQKDGAQRSHNYLREILWSGNMESRITGHYLSGSYARDTAIYPLDDVDIIFTIDPSFWINPLANAASITIFGSRAYPSSSAVLDSFANAIRYRYPISSVYGQRRSVRLQLYHLDIDVVPAIPDKKDPQRIRIPNSDTGEWILSAPKLHSENATAVNKRNNGKFKPLVKLLKYWNYNLPKTAKFKSFAVETMAVRLFSQIDLLSLQEGLYHFFDFVSFISGNSAQLGWKSKYKMSLSWLGNVVPDAAETGNNVIRGIEESRRLNFIQNAVRSRNKLDESFKTQSIEVASRKVSEALKI